MTEEAKPIDVYMRAAMAMDVFREGIWPEHSDQILGLKEDVAFLQTNYEAIKWKVGFQEASRICRAGLIYNLIAAEREACIQAVLSVRSDVTASYLEDFAPEEVADMAVEAIRKRAES